MFRISQIKQLFLLFYWLNFSQNHVLVWHIHFITIHLFTIDQSILYLSIHSFFIFLAFLSVLHSHSVFSSPPKWPMTSNFYPRFYPLHLFVLSLFFRKSQYFPFECWVPNKGTTDTIFIPSLVWRGPWLGIEPGTYALEASTLPLGYRGGGT